MPRRLPYIKPQRSAPRHDLLFAVYPYIPTSNRNPLSHATMNEKAVYPYIPTSNRNLGAFCPDPRVAVYPYIPTSNRNYG